MFDFRRILNFLGWAFIALLQVIVSYTSIFLLSTLFADLDTYKRGDWILILAGIWLSFTLGIYFVGWLYLVIRRSDRSKRGIVRLAGVALGVMIPLIILVVISLAFDFGNVERTKSVLFDNWQPKLWDLSLILGLLGFHLSGWFRLKSNRN